MSASPSPTHQAINGAAGDAQDQAQDQVNGHYDDSELLRSSEAAVRGLKVEPDPNHHDHQQREEVQVEQELLGKTSTGANSKPKMVPRLSSSTATTPITRTVAIIKTHALTYRFDIEKRIQEASFEIVKERQMEFDTETDPETLYELFGEDTDSLAEGPVWVYVLERRRAVEVWNTLMGDADLDTARRDSPNSLRALYGLSSTQNGLMGSPDNTTAEIQIASLFASSPPFPTSDLPSDDAQSTGDRFGSVRSVASSVLEQMRAVAAAAGDDEGYAPSSATNPSTVGGSSHRLNSNGKAPFKARAVPVTTDKPDIVPRTTKAAALRAGLIEPTDGALRAVYSPTKARAPVSKERLAKTFANVPGHKRAETIAVASTAAPTIAPRMTRAASLRLGQAPPPPPAAMKKRSATDPAATFEGVPGHKRRESIAVASVKAPTVAPRLNKSAALRAQKEPAPPTSFMFKSATLSRAASNSALSPPKTPASARPASQAGHTRRASSVVGHRPSTASTPAPISRPKPAALTPKTNGGATHGFDTNDADLPTPTQTPTTATTPAPAPSKVRPRPSSVIGAPSIAPRTNRSAALRAAKQEAEAAAAAAAARKGPRSSKVPPSSFKPSLAV
ncbi:unnamed protein product [Cyclocybe aegerita]|uniref:Nucleoside diphosphate kinase n=1 Tax=Cyclocybe aegerita TaxID=1973307 RepID=A0A8S0VQY4_CYCAE|nr:unnamed protein product [Cyclocybe aegerita]